MTSPYRSLEVIETYHRVYGRQYWVRDEESAHLFGVVEYVGKPGRLTCYCDDGIAHAEAPDVELPCPHMRAVIDQRAADQRAAGPKLGALRPAVFVD